MNCRISQYRSKTHLGLAVITMGSVLVCGSVQFIESSVQFAGQKCEHTDYRSRSWYHSIRQCVSGADPDQLTGCKSQGTLPIAQIGPLRHRSECPPSQEWPGMSAAGPAAWHTLTERWQGPAAQPVFNLEALPLQSEVVHCHTCWEKGGDVHSLLSCTKDWIFANIRWFEAGRLKRCWLLLWT